MRTKLLSVTSLALVALALTPPQEAPPLLGFSQSGPESSTSSSGSSTAN